MTKYTVDPTRTLQEFLIFWSDLIFKLPSRCAFQNVYSNTGTNMNIFTNTRNMSIIILECSDMLMEKEEWYIYLDIIPPCLILCFIEELRML